MVVKIVQVPFASFSRLSRKERSNRLYHCGKAFMLSAKPGVCRADSGSHFLESSPLQSVIDSALTLKIYLMDTGMETLKRIQDLQQIKVLTDPRRLQILRFLMTEPATLTQLGEAFGEHPARVRHHLKLLEKIGLVELVEERVVRGFVEKYYQARARAFLFQEIILPDPDQAGKLIFLGSHDLALEQLILELSSRRDHAFQAHLVPVGSLDGLIALRQGIAQVTGCHLLDSQSGEYNLPFVRHLFPDIPVRLVTLAHRVQGLLVAAGNPKGIHNLQDLARPDVRLVNRNRGSGTRIWLDRQIETGGLPVKELPGSVPEVRTHTAVAEAVSGGRADAGIGLYAAAQKFELDYVPLFQERFDLVFPSELSAQPMLARLLDFLNSALFRRILEQLGGYESAQSGAERSL